MIHTLFFFPLKASTPGSASMTLTQTGTTLTATQQFTYDMALTANVATVSPTSSSVTGKFNGDFLLKLNLKSE